MKRIAANLFLLLQLSQGFIIDRPSSALVGGSRHPTLASTAQTECSIPTNNAKINVLSKDPLVYVIPSLLSPVECQEYQTRVLQLQQEGQRELKKSNPPAVSLELSKLWPLPLLSIGASIPPFIRLLQQSTTNDDVVTWDKIQATVLPPIALALVATAVLAYGVVLPLVRKFASDSSRTSEALAFNLDDDVTFCADLVNRVSHITNHPWQAWEAPVVTRYDAGAIFARHGDASPTKGTEWADLGGQRVMTCICYLNNVEEGGGETSFDKLGIDVTPNEGDALVFFPADPVSLKADPRTTHESLPPNSEKWIVQMFGRIGPRVPPPLGLPDSFHDEATTTL